MKITQIVSRSDAGNCTLIGMVEAETRVGAFQFGISHAYFIHCSMYPINISLHSTNVQTEILQALRNQSDGVYGNS